MPLSFVAPEALGLYEANFIYTNLTMTYRGCKKTSCYSALPSLSQIVIFIWEVLYHFPCSSNSSLISNLGPKSYRYLYRESDTYFYHMF